MKVQRVRLPDRVAWLVLDDSYEPVQPILSYLKFLQDVGRSPNTIRATAHHLKQFWEYLRDGHLCWTEIDIAQLAGFIPWLRRPDPSVISIEQQQARLIAERCVTFEEWVAGALVERTGAAIADQNSTPFRAGPPKLLLHTHCHQRALVGTGPAARLLSSIPHCQVTDLDSGCCGMAGSFGYEREHYEISQQVGEHRLLPAVRAQAPDAVVVAAGFSCRHQIRHFTGVEAVHPAVLLRSLLAP